jgi:tetratricopeptide (TPR) repeat protein
MRVRLLILAVLSAAVIAAAAQAPGAGGAQAPTQGSSPTAGGQDQAPGATHLPQAKSKEEYDAYMAATTITDPAKLEVAADEFAKKFPDSEVRGSLYVRDMSMYGNANNTEKVIEVGRKAIAIDPTNPVPLVNVASALAESTREADLDRDARFAEAAKDAKAAIDNIDTGLRVPQNTPPEKVTAVKTSIVSMAYDTLGVIDMSKKDFAGAEQNLLKAVENNKAQPEAVEYLRLSVAQDNLKKYSQALESANQAVKYAAEGSAEQNLAKQQQARVQKLLSAEGGNAAATTTPPDTAQPSAPNSQPQPPTSTTPH